MSFVGRLGRLFGAAPSTPTVAPAEPPIEPEGVNVKVEFRFVRPEPTPEQEAAWEASRQAAALSRSGDTTAAVDALGDIYRLTGEVDPIRVAKYLQKDGRGAEAWVIYERLFNAPDIWRDVGVLDAMRLHLQREGEHDRALHYGVAHRLHRIDLYRSLKAHAVESRKGKRGLARQIEEETIRMSDQWLSELTDEADLTKLVTKLAKKGGHDPVLTLQVVIAHIDQETSARDYLASANRARLESKAIDA